MFRILGDDDPAEAIRQARLLSRERDAKALMYMRQSYSFNPAAVSEDDLRSTNRLAAALFSAVLYDHVWVFADTFADVDRSYFRRTGVVDRRYNPKLGSRVVRHLYAALNATPGELRPCVSTTDDAHVTVLGCRGENRELALLLPAQKTRVGSIECSIPRGTETGSVRVIDLDKGTTTTTRWVMQRQTQAERLQFESPLDCAAPLLLEFPLSPMGRGEEP